MPEKKNTILVVDGEPKIQKMLEVVLDAENFRIIDSTSGKQAIRMCASVKPDLMLLDPWPAGYGRQRGHLRGA